MQVEWIVGGILCVVGWLLMEIIGQGIGELLVRVFLPLRVLYRAPHGTPVLILTWIGALGGTVLGFRAVGTGLGVLGFTASIPIALIATAAYRDERRVAERYVYLRRR